MSFSDVVAVTALLVSLFGIWYQNIAIRKQLDVANFAEYARRYREIVDLFPLQVHSETFAFASQTAADQERLFRAFRAYFDLSYEQHYLWRNDLVDRRIWNAWQLAITSTIRRQSFREGWHAVSALSTYDAEFCAFVESLQQ